MAPRRPVRNAGTYQMGRPVNQAGGSARNRPVATSGALQRLAVGRNANPYALADAEMWTGAYKGETPQASKIGAWQGDTPAATPLNAPATSAADWAAIDGGSLGGIRRGSTTVGDTNDYAGADAGVMLAANNYGGGGGGIGGGVSATSAAPAAAAPAAPVAPKVNPLAALYEQLFADLGSQRSARDEFWTGQNTDLANRYQTASDNQAAAMAAAMQTLNNGVNPYQQITTPASTTTGNPLAEYMQATGVDPSQVNALVALNSANNAQYDNAVSNSLAQLGAAYDQANQSRLADLNVMDAGFRQDIDAQRNALAAQMASQQAGENAGFDQRQFEAMQAQIGDNEAFSTNNENRQMQLFQNILGSYGDSLDPQSLVNLVTSFAKATGANPASLMPVGGA